MKLGQREKDILQWILLLGYISRVDLYKRMWPKVATIIENSLFEWGDFNKIKVLLSQSLTALKKRKLITERDHLIYHTATGRIRTQDIIRKELRFRGKKKRKKK